ncbi:MAG TPA: carbohydrate-binding family 9-like protein, partial [Planctomycetota bacterium]|nr:carbohydrate-binding family 9-like protein [Planctomycetota bacterium]
MITSVGRSGVIVGRSACAGLLVLCCCLFLLSGCDKERDSDEPGKEKKAKGTASVAAPVPNAVPATPDECRWTEKPPTIDGVADEAEWKYAQTVDNFYLPWLKANARPSKTKTSAKLLWDRENLYFFAEMEDSDIYADITEHDGPMWNNDVFEIFFKPADDKPGYYEFEFSANGAKMDMFLPRRAAGGYARFKGDRPFNVTTAVKLNGTLNKWEDKDKGWSVEGRIPWRDFMASGGRPAENEIWKYAFCRVEVSVDFEGVELSTNAPLGTLHYADFHRYEDYLPLKFVGPTKTAETRPYGIEKRIPWNDSRVVGSPEPPLPFRAKKAFENLKIPNP